MSNMAEAAALRREARRKRILENSHNRLQLISGKSGDECPRELPISTITPDPEDYEIPVSSDSSSNRRCFLNNGVFITQPETFDLLSLSHDIVAAGDGEVAGDLAPSEATPTPEPVPPLSLLEKLTSYKYDIVLLSLLIQMLYGMSIDIFDSNYFFLPVIIYVVTKLIWCPKQNNSNIANMLLLLNGMTPGKLHKILYVTQCIGAMSRDICVFLFTTICIQSLGDILRLTT